MKNILALSALLALAACADVPRVPAGRQTGASATTTVSGRFDRSKRRIAVLPFVNTGREGLNYVVPDKIAARLEELDFTITSRERTEAVFRALKLDPARPLSPESLRRAGEMLQSDYLLSGTVQYEEIPASPSYTDQRGAYGGGTGPGEKLQGQTLRLTDVQTGETALSSFCCDAKFYGSSIAAELAESVARALFPERFKTSFRP